MNVDCKTINYYKENADKYIKSTKNVDMKDQYALFEKHIDKDCSILDIGFGSARDMLYFKSKGYNVSGIDCVEEFINAAKEKALDVIQGDFHTIKMDRKFNAVWACASLVHSKDLRQAFNNIWDMLNKGGIAYISMKYGIGEEIVANRFYKYVNEKEIKGLCKNNFEILEIDYSLDKLNRKKNWINLILKKI